MLTVEMQPSNPLLVPAFVDTRTFSRSTPPMYKSVFKFRPTAEPLEIPGKHKINL